MHVPSEEVDALVAKVNPVPVQPARSTLGRRATTDLERILNDVAPGTLVRTSRCMRTSRVCPLFVGLPVAAALVLVFAVILSVAGSRGGPGTAFAATPRLLTYQPFVAGTTPNDLLQQFAARTASLPDTTGQGGYAHTVRRGWDVFTAVDGQRVMSAVVPQQTEAWVRDDGSGRTVTTTLRGGQPSGGNSHDERPGELALMWPLRSLSAKDKVLAAQLERGHPTSNGPAERLVAIKDAYQNMPLTPAVRAAVLRYLSAPPGLTVNGNVIDRAGRRGIGFSIDSAYSGLPTRYTLIIDPSDGKLLASEDMLTTSAGKLNVAVPSVIGYTMYLASGYTAEAN